LFHKKFHDFIISIVFQRIYLPFQVLKYYLIVLVILKRKFLSLENDERKLKFHQLFDGTEDET